MRPVAFYQLMAMDNRCVHVVGLKVQVDYTPMPLAPRMGGGEVLR